MFKNDFKMIKSLTKCLKLKIIQTYAEEENCEAIFRRSRSEFIILRIPMCQEVKSRRILHDPFFLSAKGVVTSWLGNHIFKSRERTSPQALTDIRTPKLLRNIRTPKLLRNIRANPKLRSRAACPTIFFPLRTRPSFSCFTHDRKSAVSNRKVAVLV
jgi:hypothetical protein